MRTAAPHPDTLPASGANTRDHTHNMRHSGLWAFVLAAWVGCCSASAQDTAAQEAARRATVIAHSPPDAAKVLFGREIAPTAGPVQAIGAYERGCLSGAVPLPADGPNWQGMRP